MYSPLLLITTSLVLVAFFIHNKRYRWFYILAKTYKRDFRAVKALIHVSFDLLCFTKFNKTVASRFNVLLKKHPHKVAFYFEEETWTFIQVEKYSNKIARYFQNQGYKKGDCIALILENRPEYVCIWLGLSKIGVVTALINTNLIGDSLIHSIRAANSKAVIFGSNYSEQLKNINNALTSLKLYRFDKSNTNNNETLFQSINIGNEIKDVSSESIQNAPPIKVTDPLMYIFTSGTTGLPKAAIVTHLRFLFVGAASYYGTFCSADECIYVPLPLYHSAGGMLGLGQTLVYGIPLAIRQKFSASNYWKDCKKYNCTRAQYIGEMCRYILTVPQQPIKHNVKTIMGSGLKPQIWKEFTDKFGIENVYEYYGSTEGISNIANMDSTVGSVGFVPRYAKVFYPLKVIKCNQDTGDPIRDENGYCTECDVEEPGLVIAKINQRRALLTFKGYSNDNETQKKILQNVFCKGDKYFNSGDILVYDELGNFYFRDRTGDTFRWKGENVSTSEVEAVISNAVQLNDAVVYGVEVPHIEGRAGMATIVDPSKTLDINLLSRSLKDHLPKYAIPLFIRIVDSVPLTGTFKLKKIELRAEGYNVDKVKDALYFYDTSLEKYVPLTRLIYEKILDGDVRL